MNKDKGFYIDPSWKGVIKWGGLSLFAAGAILVIFVLSVFILQKEAKLNDAHSHELLLFRL